jgi:putative phage-type endonuclease
MPRANPFDELHKTGISATMAAVIMGVSPWESPLSLYWRIKGEGPSKEQNDAMYWGTKLEPLVARRFAEVTKLKVRRPSRKIDPNFLFRSEEYGYPMLALLDGLTYDDDGEAIVEVKTTSIYNKDEWADEPPIMYYAQAQHQMATTSLNRVYMPVLLGGNTFLYKVIERAEDVIAMMTDGQRDFWNNHILAGVPPEADGHESTGDAIKARYPHSEPDYSEVIDDPEVERLAQVYVAQGQSVEKLKDEREATGNQLRLILEDRESIVSGNYKITAKEQVARRVDTKCLKVDEPEIWERFAYEQSSRPLRVTEREKS